MKIAATLFALSGFLAGTAQASSIVTLAPSTGDPSIVSLGASPTSPSIVALAVTSAAAKSSIIALGTTPEVTYENTAAINDAQTSKSRPATAPMVIRGGIAGEAYARGDGSPQVPASAPISAPSSVPTVEPSGVPAAPAPSRSAAAPSRAQPPAQASQPYGAPAGVE